MNSPESKELMKLFKCSTDIATQVICAFVDTKVLPQHGGSFYKYLEDEKHFFYHQWEKKKIACCDCPAAGCTIHRVKKMENWMFNTFYDDTGHVHRNHFLKTGQTTQQICLHKYVARNIRLDNLDITILCFILLCAGTLTVTEKLAVETIQNKRNMICHTWSTKCFSMTQLNDIWTEIESAACSLTNPYMRHIIQSQIQSIKQCDIEKEEITLLTSKIDEINALLEEVNRKIPINSNTNIEDELTQLYVRKTEDIKQHTSQHVNQVQQALSKEIKETAQKERKEMEELLPIGYLTIGSRPLFLPEVLPGSTMTYVNNIFSEFSGVVMVKTIKEKTFINSRRTSVYIQQRADLRNSTYCIYYLPWEERNLKRRSRVLRYNNLCVNQE
ncbi:Hypothetical predicted protein [Mytilus galloprovincialis]|uniref:DZIP3-like HEPN domain-containing protein n=1 Tax=Mytilus galloprovincialis TaxID=29158 RepID=A0A8B6GRY8_MYTGA|nr:Hypothetical predicted protein [Mytilus galloprovincialis]